jgi:hypothetical protein
MSTAFAARRRSRRAARWRRPSSSRAARSRSGSRTARRWRPASRRGGTPRCDRCPPQRSPTAPRVHDQIPANRAPRCHRDAELRRSLPPDPGASRPLRAPTRDRDCPRPGRLPRLFPGGHGRDLNCPGGLATQTLPWPSIATPPPLTPVLNISALLGSDAGKRVSQAPRVFETQIRPCWSIVRWNGPANDLQGSTLRPSQVIFALVGSPLGKYTS